MSNIGKYGKFDNKDFVHHHTHHSGGSEFDGLSNLQNMVMTAREMGFPALSLTDHGSMAGVIKLIKYCNQKKDKKDKEIQFKPIKPIIGNEVYLSENHTFKSKELQPSGSKGNTHLILLAKNYKGYQNLCRITNKSWTEGVYRKPRCDFDLLDKHKEGVICTSACIASIVNYNLAKGRLKEADKVVGIFKDIYQEDFYMELQYHGYDIQAHIMQDAFKLSKKHNLPMIVTNDAHFIKKQHAMAQELLMCMSTKGTIANPKHIRHPYPEFYLKSAQEMGNIFGHTPSLLYNTVDISNKVDSQDINKNLFGGMRLPKYEVPKEYYQKDQFEGRFKYLKDMALSGLNRRGWGSSQKHIDRLNLQLNDLRAAYEVNGYDFVTYFLIEWDIMQQARRRDIITGFGRGSVYASVLSHCLGICYGVDPLSIDGMLWQRFLGFEDKKFVSEKHFGFEQELDISALAQDNSAEQELDIDESDEE